MIERASSQRGQYLLTATMITVSGGGCDLHGFSCSPSTVRLKGQELLNAEVLKALLTELLKALLTCSVAR